MRRYCNPRSDSERAMNHYGITAAQYEAYPSKYPLPARGSGLRNATGIGLSTVAVIGLAIWALARGRK